MKKRFWDSVISVPGAYLVLGFRGQGKSALGYYLTEYLGDKFRMNKIVFGVDDEARELLPEDWELMQDLEFPNDSIIIIDEISIVAYARNHKKKENELLDHLIAMSRKKNQLIFMITHHSRKVDVNLVTDVNGIIFKKPSLLHTQLDRKEVQIFSKKAYAILKEKENPKKWAYVFDFINDKEVEMTNTLPHFWSEALSNLVSTGFRKTEDELEDDEYIDDLGDFDINSFKNNTPDELWEEMQNYGLKSLRRKLLFDVYLSKTTTNNQ